MDYVVNNFGPDCSIVHGETMKYFFVWIYPKIFGYVIFGLTRTYIFMDHPCCFMSNRYILISGKI